MTDPKILVIASGHNCGEYIVDCMQSLKDQTHKDFYAILVDDASTDDTYGLLRRHAPKGHGVFRNKQREGTTMARHWALSVPHPPDTVVVWLDLDDRLLPNAVARVVEVYRERDPWLTYGNYVTEAGAVPFLDTAIPEHVHLESAYRRHRFMFMHLRTFRLDLYRHLRFEDVCTPQFPVYPDANLWFSLLELAGPERTVNLNEPLYVYNTANPISVLSCHSAAARQAELKSLSLITPKPRLLQL